MDTQKDKASGQAKPGTNPGAGAGEGDPRRTGPGSGNTRGNDLPSGGETTRDTRRPEGDGRTPATDPRDLKERRDDAQAAGRGQQPVGERASGSGMGSGGETDFKSEPGL